MSDYFFGLVNVKTHCQAHQRNPGILKTTASIHSIAVNIGLKSHFDFRNGTAAMAKR
jgi:hypothetical protein